MTTRLYLSLALGLALLGGGLQAAQTSSAAPAAATETQPSVKKPSPGPFRGKVVAVDKTARTIQIGKRTFLVTAESKITKNGKPARLEDAVVGEETGGYVKPNERGKLVATTLRLGPKVAAATPAAK